MAYPSTPPGFSAQSLSPPSDVEDGDIGELHHANLNPADVVRGFVAPASLAVARSHSQSSSPSSPLIRRHVLSETFSDTSDTYLASPDSTPPGSPNSKTGTPPEEDLEAEPTTSCRPFHVFEFERRRAGRIQRHASSSSRVSCDFFDPKGVGELRRALSTSGTRGNDGTPFTFASAYTNPRMAPAPPRTRTIKFKHRPDPIPIELVPRESVRSSFESEQSDAEVHALAAKHKPLGDLAEAAEPFDFEKSLRDVIEQRDAAHIPARKLGVLFKDLRVTVRTSSPSSAESSASFPIQPTVGSVLNPLVWFRSIMEARRSRKREILSGFNGVVRPGEMLLVLGRPGSGCSTLLKTLANHTEEYHSVSGNRHYDSFSPAAIRERYRGDVTYCPEDDIHFPSLTVAETLTFAARTRAPATRLEGTDRSHYASQVADVLMTIFGLRHARNTPVGDAALRGVSGGEKKRVSIAEALAARTLLGCWDNSTRGLDASTALEFVRALRIATDIAQITTIVSIYQAAESLYELFDKVCLIGEGRCYFFGRADEARGYFEALGYVPGPRQTTADFLVSVTDPNGRTPSPSHPFPIPRTPLDFQRSFRSSIYGQANRNEMMEYWHEFVGRADLIANYETSVDAEKSKCARRGSAYNISIGMQVKAVVTRRMQILKGSAAAQAVQLFAFMFQAVIIGTTFLNIPNTSEAFFSRGSVLYFAILFGALAAMTEIPALFSQRPIVDRHKKAAMYHPFIDALALTIVDIPITFLTQLIFAITLYFIVGLQRSVRQFFIFFLVIFTITVTMKAFYRAVAAAFKSKSSAQALAGILTLLIIMYMGYTIPEPSMVRAMKWITWLTPLRYGFEAILTNEFRTLNVTCSALVPQGPGYENVSLAHQVCTTVGSVSGQSTVSGSNFVKLAYGYSYSNLWRNFAILVAFGIAFIVMLLYFTERNTASATETSVTRFLRRAQQAITPAESPSPFRNLAISDHRYPPQKQASVAQPDKNSQPPMTSTFSWKSLSYTVPVSGGNRRLLRDVSGFVAPGKLTALMGESGAGKTTLLNVLAAKYDTGVVTGDRRIDGKPLPVDFQSQTGYCQQMDTHIPEQTVREALLFSAKLRQPQSVPLPEKEAYVEICLRMCGLEAYADAIVGTLGVEQRKRTTIGVELAAKPKLLLFLDEPTSGLDSQSAIAIMSFLRQLADNGQAILCTIHQPSSELFNVFDRLLLLRKGGETVYFGDIGPNSHTLIRYFEKRGARTCAPAENPAEWMLEVIGAGATATSETNWHEKWKHSAENTQLLEQIKDLHCKAAVLPTTVTAAKLKTEFATSWMYQTSALLDRAFLSHWRNPSYVLSKLILNILGGLIIGVSFFNADNSLQGIQNKLFAIYSGTIICIPISNQLQVLFIETRRVYEVRERSSRIYSWSSLITSQIVVETCWNIFCAIFFFFPFHWAVGFASDRAAYSILLLVVLFPIYYTSFALAIAAISPDAVTSSLLFSVLFSFVGIFNGVLQPFSQLGWWKWMYHVSPFTYLIEGLFGQVIGGQEITCSAKEFAVVEPPIGTTCSQYMATFIQNFSGYLQNPEATSGCQYCAARNTNDFTERNFNIFFSHRWRDVAILVGFIFLNVMAIYAFTFAFRIRKGRIFNRAR